MPSDSTGTALPEPTADALAHSRRLAVSIADEIHSAGGWIDFARYMERALYAPGLGYYVAGASRFGIDGDFVTAPEISPLFGTTLARQVAQVLESGGSVLELGAGSGALAVQMLGELERLGRLPDRYLILEISPDLRQRQQRRLQEAMPALHARCEWLTTLPDRFDGAIVANEVIDALPVHVLAWKRDEIFERGVAWGDSFAWSERPLEPGALRDAAAAKRPGMDYVSEISLAGPALVRSLAASLGKGVLLLIDYGFGAREYYHPQRSQGTLMCHYRHRAHGDPFFLPGLQDITAHVDFTEIAEAGIEAGLKLMGYTTQAAFLLNAGLTTLMDGSEGDPFARARLAAGAQKLLSPAEMGELFKVIALGRGIDRPLIGFSASDKSRLL